MGEKIKKLASFEFLNKKVDIELNKSSHNTDGLEIHFQSDSYRYEFTEEEYNQISSAIMLAEHNLKNYKKIK